jgi:hypothetical protein
VCAALTASGEQCGEPVESEGCSEHSINWATISADQIDLARKQVRESFHYPSRPSAKEVHRYGAPPWWPYCRRPGLC